VTEAENERRNDLWDKMMCAYIFGEIKMVDGKKTFVMDPDWQWTKEEAAELKALDAKFDAERNL
jgi:hypothetical protein